MFSGMQPDERMVAAVKEVRAAERLKVAPKECVFVDDLRENCEGAEAVGMTSVLHRNAQETIARLTELTGIELAAAA